LELENLELFDPAAQEYYQDEILQQSSPKSKQQSVPKSPPFWNQGNCSRSGPGTELALHWKPTDKVSAVVAQGKTTHAT
jgi:hypothetical protein